MTVRIVVLAGGLSAERDVSWSTGTKVCRALRQLGHDAALLDVYLGWDGDLNQTDFFATDHIADPTAAVATVAPDLARLRAQPRPGAAGYFGPQVIAICQAADIVFVGLHGDQGENGRLQAAFDLLGIRYTGSGYLASALAMHKDLAKLILTADGVRMPGGRTHRVADALDLAGVALPCVVKPCSGGSSIGVSIARSVDELRQALGTAAEFEADLLIEQYVAGREFSVGVLGDTALPVIEIIPMTGFYDYATKYQVDAAVTEVCPADLNAATTAALQATALAVHRGLGLEVYSRIDAIVDAEGDIYCLETNTLPGMTPTSLLPQEAAAAGLSYAELCQRVIDLSLAKYQAN